MAKDLTLMSWDSYPVTGWDKERGTKTIEWPIRPRSASCTTRWPAINGRCGLMELQPGHVNWSGVPVRLYPGAIRLWIWTAFAHGCGICDDLSLSPAAFWHRIVSITAWSERMA